MCYFTCLHAVCKYHYALSIILWIELKGDNILLGRAIAELYLQLLSSCRTLSHREQREEDHDGTETEERDVVVSKYAGCEDSAELSVSYFACKRHCIHAEYRRKREVFLASPPFSGWIVDDPSVTEQFVVHYS